MGSPAVNPYAAYGGAPVTPAAGSAPSGGDPYAAYGGKAGAEAPSSPPAPTHLTSNPKGEGLYHMQGPGGTAAIPFSNVEPARQQGYYFDKSVMNPGVDEEARYTKDKNFSGIDRALGTPSAGAVKSVVQIPNTIAGWLDDIVAKGKSMAEGEAQKQGHPVTYEARPIRPMLEHAEEAVAPGVTQPLHGAGEHAGGFAENLAEWLFGEGEARTTFQALSQSQKMAKVAQAAKFIEQHPALAASLRTGMIAAGSGGQAAAHGASPGESAEAAAFGGGAGALGELVSGGLGAARTAEATRQSTVAAHEAAPAVLEARTAAESASRQAAAQQTIKDVAGRATTDAVSRFNAGMAAVPGFTEAVAPAAPKTFGEGADAIKDAVRPLFRRADAVEGYDGKLQQLMHQHTEALKNLDYKAADKAEVGIDGLLDKRPADVTPAEQTAMKLAWRDAKMLDKVHAATEHAFNGISEEMAAEPGTGTRLLKAGTKEGGSLQLNLGRVLDTPAKAKEAYRVLGKDGVANLYRASNLVSNPEMAKATAALAEQVAREFPAPAKEGALHRVPGVAAGAAAGGAIGHAVGGGVGAAVGANLGAVAGGVLSDGARDVMRKMVMSPRIGQLMDFAVRNNVNPKIAAAAVAAEIQREQGERQ